jgi:glycosyltransferase involved in cell wall biosynthesis
MNGLERDVNEHGVRVIRVPVVLRSNQNVATLPSMLSYLPSSVLKAMNYLKGQKVDIVNTHFAVPSGPAGHFISKKYGIPNVLSIHGGDIFDPSKRLSPHDTPLLRGTVKRMLLGADRIVAQSSDTKKNTETYYGIVKNIDIIPLGIKPMKYEVVSREDLGLSEDRFIFITIGRLIKRKNLLELLEIIRLLNQSFPCELLVIGDGPERGNIEAEVLKLGLQERVKLLGRVTEEEKWHYLSISDSYLSTAIHEGFGIVFLEAMECGLPVICYDRGGQRDFLKDGITGYLVKLSNKELFVEKMRELLGEREVMEKMSEWNREYVREFYISRCAEKYLSLYSDLIERKGFNGSGVH